MSKKSRRPYDPYRQKQNIPVPYVRYSREAVKRQNRAVRVVAVPAFLLFLAAMLLAGIAQESASVSLKQQLYHIAIPVCSLLSGVLFVRLIFVYRKAYKERWYCVYSHFEQARMENYLPLFRTQEKQDMDKIEKGGLYGCLTVLAALTVVLAIWSLFQ